MDLTPGSAGKLMAPEDEDWTGLASASQRRRLQNRLNQRSSRLRKITREWKAGSIRRPRGRPKGSKKKTETAPLVNGQPNNVLSPPFPAFAHTNNYCQSSSGQLENNKPNLVCEMDSSSCSLLIQQLARTVNHGLRQGDPSSDMLLSLTQFNVLRAMMYNMACLGLTLNNIKQAGRISSFNLSSKAPFIIPHSLQPTNLQKTIVHHPWVDPFPIPSFRDALLEHEDQYSDIEMCNDLVGQCESNGNGHVGIIIWGEPWDPRGWEMTETFARKWFWLLSKCTELLESTNYWRSLREEFALFAFHDTKWQIRE